MFKFYVSACLLGVAIAAPYGSYDVATVGSYAAPNYEYQYAVNDPVTGDNKSQREVREGDVVKGSYSLAEPDGTIRIVEYTADAVSGFNAVVKRVGQAVHPQQIVTPVITKAMPSAYIEPAQMAPAPIHSDIGYGGYGGLDSSGLDGSGLDGYWDGGLGWGGLGGIGDHGHWSH